MPAPPVDRGDVWLADLGMGAKVRPCLVLSAPLRAGRRGAVHPGPAHHQPARHRLRDRGAGPVPQAGGVRCPGAGTGGPLVTPPYLHFEEKSPTNSGDDPGTNDTVVRLTEHARY